MTKHLTLLTMLCAQLAPAATPELVVTSQKGVSLVSGQGERSLLTCRTRWVNTLPIEERLPGTPEGGVSECTPHQFAVDPSTGRWAVAFDVTGADGPISVEIDGQVVAATRHAVLAFGDRGGLRGSAPGNRACSEGKQMCFEIATSFVGSNKVLVAEARSHMSRYTFSTWTFEARPARQTFTLPGDAKVVFAHASGDARVMVEGTSGLFATAWPLDPKAALVQVPLSRDVRSPYLVGDEVLFFERGNCDQQVNGSWQRLSLKTGKRQLVRPALMCGESSDGLFMAVPGTQRVLFRERVSDLPGTIIELDLATNTTRTLASDVKRMLDVSPDGSQLAIVQRHDLVVLEPATGEVLYTLPGMQVSEAKFVEAP